MGKKVPIEVPLTERVFDDAMQRWDCRASHRQLQRARTPPREMAEYLREIMEERLGSQEVGKH
jgi:hypothetical protein